MILKEANSHRISSAVSKEKVKKRKSTDNYDQKKERHGVEAAKTGEASCEQ